MKQIRYLTILATLILSANFLEAQKVLVLNRLGHSVVSLDISKEGVKKVEHKLSNEPANPISFNYLKDFGLILFVDHSSSELFYLTEDLKKKSSVDMKSPKSVLDVCFDKKNNDLYWIDRSTKTINRRELNNPEKTFQIDSSSKHPAHMGISNKERLLFWTDLKKGIYRYSIDTKEKSKIFSSIDHNPIKLFIDEENNFLYYSDDVNNQIYRMNFEGKDLQLIYQGKMDEAPYAMLKTNQNKLFWTDYFQGNVKMIDLVSKEVEIVFNGLNEPVDLCSSDSYRAISIRNNFNNPKLIISPNPSKGLVNFSLNGVDCKNSTVYIYDSKGKHVQEIILDGFERKIHLKNYKPGIYFCKTKCTNAFLTNSFIVVE